MDEVEEMFGSLKEWMRSGLGVPELEARLAELERKHEEEIQKILAELEERFDEVARKVAADFTSVLQRSRA